MTRQELVGQLNLHYALNYFIKLGFISFLLCIDILLNFTFYLFSNTRWHFLKAFLVDRICCFHFLSSESKAVRQKNLIKCQIQGFILHTSHWDFSMPTLRMKFWMKFYSLDSRSWERARYFLDELRRCQFDIRTVINQESKGAERMERHIFTCYSLCPGW